MNQGNKTQNDRWVTDLNWVLTSPFLMGPDGSAEGDFSLSRDIGNWEINEEQAELYSEKYAGHRVGYYFESLIHYWLEQVRGAEILAQGFQILQDGRTLGELDFVFRDEEGRINHWEVAAKFYLYHEEQKVKGSHYIGPNAQDTFELKREKIFGQQLPLSKTAFPEVNRRLAFVKGRVFYHPESKEPNELPLGLMPNHLRGIWIRYSELSWLERKTEAESTAYHLVEKPFWLSPECFSVSDTSLLQFRDLKEHMNVHFSKQKHPILISALVRRGEEWQESCRAFVVADDWPVI